MKTGQSEVTEIWNEYEPLEHHFIRRPEEWRGFATDFWNYEEVKNFANLSTNLLRKVSIQMHNFEVSNESTHSI
jgi:hypothetical protein